MALACDSTSPSPCAQTPQVQAHSWEVAWGWSCKSGGRAVAGQLCVLQLHVRRLFFTPFLFPQTWKQYFGSEGVWGG